MRSPATTWIWWRVPRDDGRRVLVWSIGGALLAVPLDAVVEIAPIADDEARTRGGRLPLRTIASLETTGVARRAVVLRSGATLMAVAADEVEGVHAASLDDQAPTPAWLTTLPTDHLAGLIQLTDVRVAALLAVESLGDE